MAGTPTPTEGNTPAQSKEIWTKIIDTVKAVITNPAEFYRGMPKTGGFQDPLIFMVVMGVATGLIQAILGIVHVGMRVSVGMALASIVISPIIIGIAGFIGGAILFVIWKLMGSQESYETAYRCGAYAAAIWPITTLLGIIPYIGPLIGLAWGLWLLVIASVEVHKIAAKTAWLVFGIIAALLAILSLGAQAAGRRAVRTAGDFQKQYSESLKAMQKAQEDAAREAAKQEKTAP